MARTGQPAPDRPDGNARTAAVLDEAVVPPWRHGHDQRSSTVWDTVELSTTHLSHDLPCQRCGHAGHTYLGCGDGCDCEPAPAPGER
jgi:hypothetical protein